MTTPTITLYPDTLPAKGQANDAFDVNVNNFLNWLTLTNGPELSTMIAFTVDVRDTVLATALAGNLPPLTGEALNLFRVNAAEDGGEFRTPAQVKADIGLGGITDNSTATAITIDASGNVMVGKTVSDFSIAGFMSAPLGNTGATVSNASPFFANRLGTDGKIFEFYKSGSSVGNIGVTSGIFFIASAGQAGIRFAGGARVEPSDSSGGTIDNFVDLGAPGNRFQDIYATNGTIQTSDRNEKESIAALTPTEMRVAARLSASFKNFKWKSVVAEKGDAARLHSGIIAQDVQDAFAAESLNAGDYAMFISSTWWEAKTDVSAVEAVAEELDADGNVVVEAVEAKDAYTSTDTFYTLEDAPEGATERTRVGVRYPELLAFVAAYNDQRFLAIEARITTLEGAP